MSLERNILDANINPLISGLGLSLAYVLPTVLSAYPTLAIASVVLIELTLIKLTTWSK